MFWQYILSRCWYLASSCWHSRRHSWVIKWL